MNDSEKFNLMLEKAMSRYPGEFGDFDKTKNVQDQLQEMITDKGYFRFSLIEGFYQFCTPQVCSQFSSMSQLWLAYFMYLKFNEFWNMKDKWGDQS